MSLEKLGEKGLQFGDRLCESVNRLGEEDVIALLILDQLSKVLDRVTLVFQFFLKLLK